MAITKKYSFGNYKVVTKKQFTGSNYDVSVHIKKDNKIVCGFFHKNDKIHEITPLVKNSIKEYENQTLLL